MTITLGFWVVPTLLTIVGIIHSAHNISHDRNSYGIDIIPLIWLFGVLVAWVMYLLSLLFG